MKYKCYFKTYKYQNHDLQNPSRYDRNFLSVIGKEDWKLRPPN